MFVEAAGIILLATLLYSVLEKQNKVASRYAFGLWIAESISLVIRSISAFALMNISLEFANASFPMDSHFQTLGVMFSLLTQLSYTSLMVFYCIGGMIFCYLFFRARSIPAIIPAFGMITVARGFIGTILHFFNIFVPFYVFLPILPFELAIGIWLLIKGCY